MDQIFVLDGGLVHSSPEKLQEKPWYLWKGDNIDHFEEEKFFDFDEVQLILFFFLLWCILLMSYLRSFCLTQDNKDFQDHTFGKKLTTLNIAGKKYCTKKKSKGNTEHIKVETKI